MRPLILFSLAIALDACSSGPITTPEPTPTIDVVSPVPSATVTSTIVPEPTPTPEPQQYVFVALGGDWREHRVGTKYGNKTDVSLIVIVTMSDPVDILVLQLPRNLYVPTSLGDLWNFAVYGQHGFDGYRQYIREVLGLEPIGMAFIHMDAFERFIDDLGGLWLGGVGVNKLMDGEEALAYLRDNDNNWGCPEYDCGNRQHQVLLAIADKIKTQFHEDPWVTTTTLWDSYGELFQTDMTDLEQLHWIVELGWLIATSDYEIRNDKLTQSGSISYGDTPLEVRGWIETGDIKEWITEVINAP